MCNKLSEKFDKLVCLDVLLSEFSSYKIGGPAKYFGKPKNLEELRFLIDFATNNNINWFVIGSGSNILFSDIGYDGLIIKLSGDFNNINFDKQRSILVCGAGVSLAKIVNYCKENSLIGAEFLCGIPGKLGGAIKMNAGLKKEWISDILSWVKILNKDGSIKIYSQDQLQWGYRSSSIGDSQVVLEAALCPLHAKDDKQALDSIAKVEQLINSRKEKQPYQYPSCGSVFKNPEGQFSAKLIEQANLKEYSVGGAQVSAKHANFIINKNNATAKDVVDIVQKIQRTIYDKNDIMLYPELKFVGFNEECSLF